VELQADVALAEGDAEWAATRLAMAEAVRGMPDESQVDVVRMHAAARAALGDRGFALASRRGAVRPRQEVLAALADGRGAADGVSSAAGRPAGPGGRTPPR
jgi:hypothetical protein